MKINKILNKIIILAICIIMCTCSTCFAKEESPTDFDGGEISSSRVGSSVGLPNLNDNGYKPTLSSGDRATAIISKILGVLTVIGIIAIVIAIALIGFGTVLGSASQKAENQGKYVGILIAAGLITGGSIIARMIISVAEAI